MLQTFSIEKLGKVLPLSARGTLDNTKELLRMGYFVSPFLATQEVVQAVKAMTGSHVKHKPFYPNFDHDVLSMSPDSYLLDQLCHYWFGLRPDATSVEREAMIQEKFTILEEGTITEVSEAYKTMLSTKDNLSTKDKEYAVALCNNFDVPEMSNKQTLALMVGCTKDYELLTTSTDVLRYLVSLNGGNTDLTEQVKFKKLPKAILARLEQVINEEDIRRHKAVWKILFKLYHVNKKHPKTFAIAFKLRSNQKLETYAGRVDAATSVAAKSKVLMERPSEFARRILSLGLTYLPAFVKIVEQVPVKVLVQLWGACKAVENGVDFRNILLPSGASVILPPRKTSETCARIIRKMCMDVVRSTTGAMSIDPALYNCPLPTGQASATDNVIARGSRIPLTEDFVRFFVYWKGQDIDLSASFYDESFVKQGELYYGNASYSNKPSAYHSGDITRAPEGASEFIDLDLTAQEHRYIVMDVRIYSGHESYNEMDEVFAGFMERNDLQSGEVFEASTVKFKFDLNGKGKLTQPLIIDTKTREVIWIDGMRSGRSHDNAANDNTSFLEIAMNLPKYKVTLGELLELRGDPEKDYALDYALAINEINSNLI